MKKIGLFEAKVHFSELVEEVFHGEVVQITKHGIPVARLMPISERSHSSIIQASEEILKLRQSSSLKGISVKALKETGRR